MLTGYNSQWPIYCVQYIVNGYNDIGKFWLFTYMYGGIFIESLDAKYLLYFTGKVLLFCTSSEYKNEQMLNNH